MGKKIKRTYLIAAVTLVLIALLLPTITGCTPEGKELALAFLREWAREKKIDPGTAEGIWNITQRTLGDSTGDEEADAAIDAGLAVKNLIEADKLMEEGQKDGNIKKMDQAIAMRPNDWTYRITKSSLCLKQNNMDEYLKEATKVSSMLNEEDNTKSWNKYWNQQKVELEQVREELDWKGYASDQQKAYLYHQLSLSYYNEYQQTGSEEAINKSNSYKKVSQPLLESHSWDK